MIFYHLIYAKRCLVVFFAVGVVKKHVFSQVCAQVPLLELTALPEAAKNVCFNSTTHNWKLKQH